MRKNCNGLTLIEIIVSVTILGMIFAISFSILSNYQDIYVSSVIENDLYTQNQIILNRIIEKMENIPANEIIPYNPIDSNSIKFRKIISVDDYGNRLFSNYIELAFSMVTSEKDNNIDDNGDGIVDEGFLVCREYNNEGVLIRSDLIGRNVMKYDPTADLNGKKGISFTKIDSSNKISISLSLEKPNPKGRISTDTRIKATFKSNLKAIVVLKN